MSEDKDDDKVRTRFDDLEKQIVTDGFNPGGKPDFLTQRNKKHRMRGLDSPTVLSGQDPVPAVVPPSVLRVSALTVVYLVVLAGFAWTGWNATVGYLGTHGQGMAGRVVISKCADGNWYAPGTRCTGFFVPTDAQQLRHGVVVTNGVTTLGAGKSSAGKQVHGQLLSTGNTVYTSGWTGWIWYGVAALVLLALLVFLTFRRRGLVPGVRATLAARGARKARVQAQEQAKERARELRKKRAAEARARNTERRSEDEATAEDAPKDTASGDASEPGTETAPDDTGSTDATGTDTAEAQPEKKTGGTTRKVLKPRPPAKRSGRSGGTSPAHVGTATGTTKTVGPDDLPESGAKDEHDEPAAAGETKAEGD